MTIGLDKRDLELCNWEYADVVYFRVDPLGKSVDLSWRCPLHSSRLRLGDVLGAMRVHTVSAALTGVDQIESPTRDPHDALLPPPWESGDCKDLELQGVAIDDSRLRVTIEHREFTCTFEAVALTIDEGDPEAAR